MQRDKKLVPQQSADINFSSAVVPQNWDLVPQQFRRKRKYIWYRVKEKKKDEKRPKKWIKKRKNKKNKFNQLCKEKNNKKK